MPTSTDRNAKFTRDEGIVQLGGMEALVRLTLDQVRTDRRRGLNTGMFVSGYRGSPIGMLDEQLLRQQKLLLENNIHFVDGLNEDLAATAVWGTQMLHAVGRQKFDGVTGMWYGKAPGVDRSGDALKHANYTGIAENGGILAVVGDDPSCKSSSLPSQSEPLLFHVGIPTLYPGNVQEILDLGLHGYYLSRIAGLWIGLKVVTNVADGHGNADVSPNRLTFSQPSLEVDGRPFIPHMNLGMNVRVQALEMERALYGPRLEMARRYAYENKLNVIAVPNSDAWLGIIVAGKTYGDLRECFHELGLDETALRRCGIRVLKIGMLFPLEPRVVREFARGLEEILVIEEKRPFLEMFAKNILYGQARAPRILGKYDEHEQPLLPHHGEFDSEIVGRAIAGRLRKRGNIESVQSWLKKLDEVHSRASVETVGRTAWYCSGCPHSTSTLAPPESIVSAGIGCHTMAMWMGRNVVMGTHMGAEGAQWIGMAPFTEVPHIFQNIGDGTYFHSGSLAIRYAAASGVNITYKLLYNGHVSMTGGQEAMGNHPVKEIVAELLANGVERIIVTTEDLGRYEAVALPSGAEIWHRDRILEAQRLLAATPGTTVLIHDQECAAELRRLRGRGKRPQPSVRVVINERVCEGCGDCGVKSNCMSVEPVETEFGRKTRIHDPTCNKDYSCIKGFCPAFLTITPDMSQNVGEKAGRLPSLDRELPQPESKVCHDFTVHVMGIGGTGSVTVVQTIAAAARLEGRWAIGLDQTGLAQKGGPVISDLKISSGPHERAAKVSDAGTDLYLGFDILNATDRRNLDKCDPDRTIAIVSTSQSPTGYMVSNKDVHFPAIDALIEGINNHTRRRDNVFLDAQNLAEGLFASNMAANTFMVGVAYQAGALPIDAHSLEEAIRQTGIAIDMSVLAFRWGRMSVVDPAFVRAEVNKGAGKSVPAHSPLSEEARQIVESIGVTGELHRLVTIRVAELIAYQDAAYARRYAEAVRRTVLTERRKVQGKSEYSQAVARYLFKLMAYKDEFEVARLHSDPEFIRQLSLRFGPNYKVHYHLSPPVLASMDPETGMPRKRKFGRWIRPLFSALTAVRSLRGGFLDPFARTEERRRERALIERYLETIDKVSSAISFPNYAVAVQIATIPDDIRGYGHVKMQSLQLAKEKETKLLQEYFSLPSERSVA